MAIKRYYSSVSPKGQITLPSDVRKTLDIKPRDQVTIEVEGSVVQISVSKSRLARHYQVAGSLSTPRDWKDMVETAADEHSEHVAREGLS